MESNIEFFVALFTDNYQGLLDYADRKTKDFYRSEDLVMDTIACAWVHLDTIIVHPYPHKWLYKTLQNKLSNDQNLKYHQAEQLTPSAQVRSFQMEAAAELADSLPDQLSNEERDLICWRFELGLTNSEIAARLGISTDAAKKRSTRAVEHCRKIFLEEKK